MKRTRIKICGITTPETAAVAASAGADFIGVVFAPTSPRCVEDSGLLSEIIAAIRDVPAPPIPVGVFADAFDPPPAAYAMWREFGDWVQLHAPVTRETARSLAQSDSIRLVPGVHFDAAAIRAWNDASFVHALLIDGPTAGSGVPFDHRQLAMMMSSIVHPVILAGGLTVETVSAAISAVSPFGVDVSSGVESARGTKDPTKIKAFCAAVRHADAERRSTG